MYKTKHILISALFIISLASCNMPGAQQAATQSPEQFHTFVAQTVTANAQSGQSTSPSETPAPGDTSIPQPGETLPPELTNTLPATNTPEPTNTPLPSDAPTSTNTPIPCNLADFVTDITIPDGTDFNPGESFVKTWRLRNIGSCSWSSGYNIVLSSGDAMSAPAAVQLTNTIIPPGGTVDVSVTLVAPASSGTYRGNWKLRDASNQIFGIQNASTGEFYVEIEVLAPTDTPVPTIIGPIIVLTPFVEKVYKQDSIAAGNTGYVTATCPTHSIVTGGGYATDPNVLVYNHSKEGNGWRVYVKNFSGSNKSVNAYAVCLFNVPGASTTQVYQQVNVSGGQIGHAQVSCPAGTIVTGGGWATNHQGSLHLYNSSRSGNGWGVYVKNKLAPSQLLNAYAICLSSSGSWSTQQVGKQETVPGNSTKGVVAICPSGTLATGGGFAGSTDLKMYNTSPWHTNGTEWITYGKNTSGSGKLLNSYAICLSTN